MFILNLQEADRPFSQRQMLAGEIRRTQQPTATASDLMMADVSGFINLFWRDNVFLRYVYLRILRIKVIALREELLPVPVNPLTNLI